MNKLKKKWIFICLLTAILLGISGKYLLSKSIEFYIFHSISNLTGRQLTADSILRMDETWVLNNPKLCKNGENLCAANIFLNATRATLSYSINLWKREINLNIILEEPKFKIHHPDTSFSLAIHDGNLHQGFFEQKTHVKIHQGQINLGDESYGINGELFIGSAYKGNFDIDFKEGSPEVSENNHLFVHFVKDPSSAGQLDVRCQEMDCRRLHHLAKFLSPALHDFEVYEGVLQGSIGFILKPNGWPSIYGESHLKHFNFEHLPTGVRGSLNQVNLNILKNYSGHIAFNGMLSYALREIKNLQGLIRIDDRMQAKIEMEGIYGNCGQKSQLLIEGEGSLASGEANKLNLTGYLNDSKHHSSGSIKINELAENTYQAQFNLNHQHHQDIVLLQALLKLIPQLKEVSLVEGNFDINAKAMITKHGLDKILFENINISHLKAMHSLLNAAFDIENVLGHGTLGLTEGNALETNLQLNIVAGQIFSLANPLLKIENILCKINFSQGKIVNSHAEGCFGEMFGTVDINNSHACKLLLHGKMNDLIKHVPHEKMRKNLLGTFNRHQVVIAADLNHHPQKEELVGLVKIVDAEGKEQPLTFGCELTPGSLDSNLHQAIPCKLFTVNPVSFNFTSPETSLTLLDHDFYHLRHGWFEGDDLPLKKFIEPILTEIIPFNISGTGNLKGCFDRMKLNISYEAHHVCLENDLLVINVDEIKREPFKHNAEHFFDFRTGRHRGSLPLINATYLDKNTGLLFTDINADLHFAGNKMHVTSIESYCKGIYISGALDIDAYDLTKGSFDLDIYPQTVYGKMTQVQNFFSHFNPTLFFLSCLLKGM